MSQADGKGLLRFEGGVGTRGRCKSGLQIHHLQSSPYSEHDGSLARQR